MLLIAWSLIADYLSLLKTRLILYWLDSGRMKRNILLLPLLIGDFCFSTIVFAVVVAATVPASVMLSAIGAKSPAIVMWFIGEMFSKGPVAPHQGCQQSDWQQTG